MLYTEGQEHLTYEQKQEHIAELWAEIHRLTRSSEMFEKTADYRSRRIADVDFYMQEEDNWEKDTETVLSDIAGILDIDITTEKTFEVKVSHTVVVSGKRGADWSEIDGWAFSLPEIDITLSDFDIQSCDTEVEEVEEV